MLQKLRQVLIHFLLLNKRSHHLHISQLKEQCPEIFAFAAEESKKRLYFALRVACHEHTKRHKDDTPQFEPESSRAV